MIMFVLFLFMMNIGIFGISVIAYGYALGEDSENWKLVLLSGLTTFFANTVFFPLLVFLVTIFEHITAISKFVCYL